MSSFTIARSRGPTGPCENALQGPAALGQGGLALEPKWLRIVDTDDHDDDDDDGDDDDGDD